MLSQKEIGIKQSLRHLIAILFQFKGVVLTAFFLVFLKTYLEYTQLQIIKPILDTLGENLIEFDSKIIQLLFHAALSLAILSIGRFTAEAFQQWLLTWLSGQVILKLRITVISQILNLTQTNFSRYSKGEILSRITYDTNKVSELLSLTLFRWLQSLVRILFFLVMLAKICFWLTLVWVLTWPLLIWALQKKAKFSRRINKEKQLSMNAVASCSEETVKGFRDIKLLNAIRFEVGKFSKKAQAVFYKTVQQGKAQGDTECFIRLFSGTTLSFLIYSLSYPFVKQYFSRGDFYITLEALQKVMSRLKDLALANLDLQPGFAACQSLFYFYNLPQEQETGSAHLKGTQGHLKFHDVHFTYPTRKKSVIQNISFEVKPGKLVALVGSSGAGKSTIANLIARFYCPTKGELTLDAVPIHNFTRTSYRQHIAFVSQSVHIFPGSIASNIAYACGQTDKSVIIEAAKLAHVLDFVQALPQGLDTIIDEKQQLSAGQRQRIGIARALLRKSPILILDEATAALDSESECAIQDTLENLRKNYAIIVIAHKLSLIEKADEILVLQHGEIVERGKHKELLKKSGFYAKLYKAGRSEE